MKKQDINAFKDLLPKPCILGDGEVEDKFGLFHATKDEAGEIVQFLIAYHKLKTEDFDWNVE